MTILFLSCEQLNIYQLFFTSYLVEEFGESHQPLEELGDVHERSHERADMDEPTGRAGSVS